eukprot:m.235539 g.235539  ORF g.235539 m.235539 type:complete len:909 (+) comp12845_c0_seq1:91-2817(+)
MAFVRRSNGGADKRYYEKPETHDEFDGVRAWLSKAYRKYVSSETLDGKALASLTASIIQFQEDVLGKTVKDRVCMRLPAKVFLDYSDGGAVCLILGEVFKYKHEQGLRRAEFSTAKSQQCLEMLMTIHNVLVEAGKIAIPRVHLAPSLPAALRTELTSIITDHQWKIAPIPESATHCIVAPATSYGDSEEYYRVIDKADDESEVLVHWWYYPDSYDTWCSHDGSSADIEPPPIKARWNLNARWLLDMRTYNEIMNEEDYEEDSAGADGADDDEDEEDTRSKAKSKKKKEKKEKARDDADDDEDEPAKIKKIKVKRADSRSEAVEPPAKAKKRKADEPDITSPAPDQGKSKKRKADEAREASPEPEERKTKKDKKGRGLSPSPPPRVPIASSQPEVKVVNCDEELARAGNKESDFRPLRTSTVVDISDSTGPVRERAVQTDADTGPKLRELQTMHIIVPSSAAWFDRTTVADIESRALPEFFTSKNRSKTPEIYMAYRNFMIDTYRLRPTEYLTATACRRSLAGDVCAVLRVHAFLEHVGLINYQVDIETRPSPMGIPTTGHFSVMTDAPSGLTPMLPAQPVPPEEKILKVSAPAPKPIAQPGVSMDLFSKDATDDEADWTEQEVLALLEGIDQHKEDWLKVAEHVNTTCHGGETVRTHEECITAFIRMPIEDPYLEADPSRVQVAKESFPFSQAPNPIMATLGLLATAVDPSVAAEGARAALIALTKASENKAAATKPEPDTAASGAAQVDGDVPNDTPVGKEQLQAAATAVLTSAAQKARYLAAAEERKMRSLVALLLQAQLRKLEIKLRHFDDLETIMEQERQKLETQRQALLAERQAFNAKKLQAEQALQNGTFLEFRAAQSQATPGPSAAAAASAPAGHFMGAAGPAMAQGLAGAGLGGLPGTR